MTHTRQMADSEGDFGRWQSSERKCQHREPDGTLCGLEVHYREWESSDGGWVDYQYRCEVGHTFWVDGIDS